LLFTTPFVALVAIFPRFFAGLFFPRGFEGEALEYAVMFATGCLPFILINIINNLFHSYFRGIAAARLLLLSTAVLSVARLILTYLFVGYGMRGVFLGWAGSWAVSFWIG
jgi:O-antigen/teichoic acid export membrane protein